MAARGRFAARGRGRGAVAEIADEPPQAEVPCDQTAEFFGSLLPGNWPLFLTVDAPIRCLTCRFEPRLHRMREAAIPAVAQAAGALVVHQAAQFDPLLRQGPAPALPLSPGETLRSVLSDWKGVTSVLAEDREKWDRLFCEMSMLLFDPFSRVLLEHLVAVGTTATTRKWTTREAMPDDAMNNLSMALRSAKDLGVAVIGIMRIECRYRWKSSSSPILILDGEHELPVSVFVAESILKSSPMFVPGARLPPSAVITDPQYSHWWGVLAATIPIETFIQTLRDFFQEHIAAWCARPENKGLVVSTTAFRASKARRAADDAHMAAAAAVVSMRTRATPSFSPAHSVPSVSHASRRRPRFRERSNGRGDISVPNDRSVTTSVTVPSSGALVDRLLLDGTPHFSSNYRGRGGRDGARGRFGANFQRGRADAGR